MFTGIVEETGRVEAFERTATGWRLRVAAGAILSGLAAGESVAINGCCLTAVAFDAAGMSFDVLEETRRSPSARRSTWSAACGPTAASAATLSPGTSTGRARSRPSRPAAPTTTCGSGGQPAAAAFWS